MTTSPLQEGQKAPDFSSLDQNGNTITLSEFLGKKVCLYFYPKDNTPGCTAQACNLRDNYQQLLDDGWVVLGVSTDNLVSHKKFETKYHLPFPLVADEDKSIVTAYGVWSQKKFMGKTYMGTVRTTFLIDEKGIIKHIISKPKTSSHSSQITTTWSGTNG